MLPIFTNRGQEVNPITYVSHVPQRNILGPALFNSYVAELADRRYSTTIQYADDTALYQPDKISKLHECAVAIHKGVEKLLSWSQQNNLTFNSDKLQSILFSSPRLSSKHNLEDSSLLIHCSGQSILQKSKCKAIRCHIRSTPHMDRQNK